MAQVLVVADDLTGANATGVLLKKNGYSSLALLVVMGFLGSLATSVFCRGTPLTSRYPPTSTRPELGKQGTQRVLPRKKVTGPGKVLMAIGSVNGVARAQVKELLGGLDICHTYLDTSSRSRSPTVPIWRLMAAEISPPVE